MLFLQLLDGEGAELNYERCEIANDIIYLGQHLANIGLAVASYSRDRPKTLTLPTPPQEFLTTFITDCNSFWLINDYTNIEILGNKILPECHVKVKGLDTVDALLTVDFSIDDTTCTEGGYSVELDKGTMVINDSAMIEFGEAFKNIIIIMSPCKDVVRIKETYSDTLSVLIKGGAGNGK